MTPAGITLDEGEVRSFNPHSSIVSPPFKYFPSVLVKVTTKPLCAVDFISSLLMHDESDVPPSMVLTS
jgi:hypothetical protein